MIKRAGGRIRPGAASGTTRTYGVRDRRILLSISDIGGRPVVLYTDAPGGVSPAIDRPHEGHVAGVAMSAARGDSSTSTSTSASSSTQPSSQQYQQAATSNQLVV